MATKLPKKTFPAGHTADDFECFGPAAREDGQFDSCMVADLGCFNQDMIDSNKMYHGAAVKSKTNSKWYTYFEWGRTGKSADFLFTECYDKDEAQKVLAKQLHSKNDKRGEWITLAGRQVLRAKSGKDCYLVRPAARRTTGLPDAQKIINDDSDQTKKKAPTKTAKKKITKKAVSRWDANTLKLAYDLVGGTVDYTKKSFSGGYIPTQATIDEARDILTAALQRVKKVGDNTKSQVNDKELKQLTTYMYGRIPKAKPIGADPSTWILSGNNIQTWQFDLDAFETALVALDTGAVDDGGPANDPFAGFDLEMVHAGKDTKEGKFVRNWMPEASGNQHYHVGSMRILNVWAMRQPSLGKKFSQKVDVIATQKTSGREKPKFQPRSRTDLNAADKKRFSDANVGLLLHGTRSVNTSGILRTGFKMPKQLVGVSITGAMFGCVFTYFADDWRKSVGYCSLGNSYWAGGSGNIQGRGAFMFVADCALGTPFVASGPRGYTKVPDGHHCIFGKAGHSGVMNNEWMVPPDGQINLRYLVEFSTK